MTDLPQVDGQLVFRDARGHALQHFGFYQSPNPCEPGNTSVPCPPERDRLGRQRVDSINADLPGKIPVVDANGKNQGVITKHDYDRLITTPSHDASGVMVPVRDRRGHLTGYFANGTGFIPRSIAEAPGFDLKEYRTRSGK